MIISRYGKSYDQSDGEEEQYVGEVITAEDGGCVRPWRGRRQQKGRVIERVTGVGRAVVWGRR